MELRAFAEQVLLCPELPRKLAVIRPPWTDHEAGSALRVERPARPEALRFAGRREAPPMPHPDTFHEPHRRGIAHHIMANHELQALEVMAWTLLAFPDAPTAFRRGVATIMQDEQRHTRMHAERAQALGVPFGSLPVNSYIWQKAMQFADVLDYLAGLPLTFEGGNLDHTIAFAEAFLRAGDLKSAAIMRRIHADEIEHVAFGYRWLEQLKPEDCSTWQAYLKHLHWPLRPEKSVGDPVYLPPRQQAGLSADFLQQLQTHLLRDDPDLEWRTELPPGKWSASLPVLNDRQTSS